MSEDIAKIKDRVAKLLAMAADSSSPEESAIAAERARKLMDKYQLEAWECEREVAEAFIKKDGTRAYSSLPVFLSTLSVAVARFNDCQARFAGAEMTYKMKSKRNQNEGRSPNNWGKKIVFMGYESDVQVCCDMFDKLVDAMNKQCKTYLEPFGYAKYPVKQGTAFKTYFCEELIRRLVAMTRERNELLISSTGTSLVVIKAKAVDDHFGEVEYGKAKYSSDLTDNSVHHAAQAGRAAGARQNIMEEVGDKSGSSRARLAG